MSITLRRANEKDIPKLLLLENICFDQDRLTVRRFRWMILKAQASFFIAETDAGELAGYVLTLFRKGTSRARHYSLALNPAFRNRGIARRLLETGEEEARQRGAKFIRLEVRPDNESAIRLYESLGYRKFGLLLDFYEDHADALRYEKQICSPTSHPSLLISK